jgi:hypothetical protein
MNQDKTGRSHVSPADFEFRRAERAASPPSLTLQASVGKIYWITLK